MLFSGGWIQLCPGSGIESNIPCDAEDNFGNRLPPPYQEIQISRSRFVRGQGYNFQFKRSTTRHIVGPAPPAEANDEGDGDLIHCGIWLELHLSRFLPYFNVFVRRPVCVKYIWRYNLQFVSRDLRENWNTEHPDGQPEHTLFAALRNVVEHVAQTMLLHLMYHRKQQWAVSGLSDVFANSTETTMNAGNIDMEVFDIGGIGGIRAHNF